MPTNQRLQKLFAFQNALKSEKIFLKEFEIKGTIITTNIRFSSLPTVSWVLHEERFMETLKDMQSRDGCPKKKRRERAFHCGLSFIFGNSSDEYANNGGSLDHVVWRINLHEHQYIVQKMRELARFMVKVKELSKSVKTLEKLCELCSGHHCMQGALKIGYSLKKACQISLGQSLMSGDTETERNVKNFIKLIDSHWRTNISSKALNTLQQAKWNKGDTIPLTEDVMALQKHLRKQEQESKEKLRKNANTADWKVLAETLLCQIILFNRRREGEASKLLLTVYEKRNVKPPNQDVVKSLTKLEQQLCSELTQLEIRGKRGKKVPVLLTKDMVDSIDVLNGSREKIGVTKDNPYVFAEVERSTHIRGSDCLRKYAAVCGVKDPKSLTSTQLRKQVATLCRIMNLKDNELDQLAKFMGHDIRVHHYS
ncbi:hypothetical protein M9458_052197 [Cirrhinus mrigala]|uniref:Uncharacterized protein n=1 Tax=Cirrhinus mrigala TaxID=683832 RepID=A0ABD0MR08_CIRMR